jgi:hypothetical protein
VTRLITASRRCFSAVFNNDDYYYNNNKLYQKQVANVLSFGKEINMSSTEIERRAGALYCKTASLIKSDYDYIEKCKVKVAGYGKNNCRKCMSNSNDYD